ncbi:dephospho-CoA kinase [Tenggerimyces flavus]|uniref:Dephospho-CoA kinase n=1 Tax=Tenggerimyces flavus TaxID=1708749 RepID=A0ABV7YLG0_9ACTN|nr:dephospho-CoA kinase [Tenggerimyces flavus]MBM7787596.1 dephospho-CoA kinase [Tenggerimyces flavus]
MLRIGLTGGIASGKSEVTRLLAQLGAVVIDADLLAREVVAPGTDGLTEVTAVFGPGVLGPDGALDRPALGRVVFGDEAARRKLEAIVHPRVRARAAALEADAPPDAVVVHSIPLLVETGQARNFDQLVIVDVPEDVQIERLERTRGMSEAEARSRIAAQASRDDRRAAADVVLDNSGTLADLERQVRELWDRLQSTQPRAAQ